jgi:hypothetical protein
MKKTTLMFTLMAFVIAFSIQVSGQKADFDGSWKLDESKSTLPQFPVILVKIDVTIKGDSLFTERFYDTGDGQIYPFTENLTLDNKEYLITIYDMPRKAKAAWSEGGLSLESSIVINGDSGPDNFISKETWSADSANKTLSINFKNSTSAGEESGVFFFNKAE